MGQINQAMQDIERVARGTVAAIRQAEETARNRNTLSTRMAGPAGRSRGGGTGCG